MLLALAIDVFCLCFISMERGSEHAQRWCPRIRGFMMRISGLVKRSRFEGWVKVFALHTFSCQKLSGTHARSQTIRHLRCGSAPYSIHGTLHILFLLFILYTLWRATKNLRNDVWCMCRMTRRPTINFRHTFMEGLGLGSVCIDFFCFSTYFFFSICTYDRVRWTKVLSKG